MERSTNKRQCGRQSCEATIEWTYFNQGQYQRAVKRNDGRRGFYFESPSCPKINAAIFVKPSTGRRTEGKKHGATGYRTTAVARVKWIKVLQSGDDPLFGIGAEYFESSLDPLF